MCSTMKVRDFSEIRSGHGFRERLAHDPGGAYRVIQPKNIQADGWIGFDRGEPLRTAAASPKVLRPNEVLLVNRGRFSAAVFEPADDDPCIVPSSILVLTMKTDRVRPEYVACFFNSAQGQALLQRHCEQTTVPYVSAQTLGDIDIPMPARIRQDALVALERAVARHARLSRRKQELIRQMLNHELTNQATATIRSEP